MTIQEKETPAKKTNYQPLITIVLLLLLACSITWAFSERHKKDVAQTLLDSKKILKDPTAPSVKEFKDSLKQNHNTFENTKNVVGSQTGGGKDNIAISPTLLDTIAKMSNVKPGSITDWKLIATSTEARALKAERMVDSLQRVTFFYKDRFLKLAYRPASGLDTTDKGSFDFNYDADLTTTQFTTRGKILGLPIGQKREYTDIYSNDPRTTIRGLKTFRVQQREPLLGFRLQGLSNYSFRRKTFSVGLGGQFYVGRLSFTGSYLYIPQEEAFSTNAGLRYDIFK